MDKRRSIDMRRTLLIVALMASVSTAVEASSELTYDDMLALSVARPGLVAQESGLRTLAKAYGIPVGNPYAQFEEEDTPTVIPREKLPTYMKKTLKKEPNAEGQMVEEIFVPLTVQAQTMTRQCITTAETLLYRIQKGELVEGLDFKRQVLVDGVEVPSPSQPTPEVLKRLTEDRLISTVSRFESRELKSEVLEGGLRRITTFYPITAKMKTLCRQFATSNGYLMRMIEEGKIVEGRDYLIRETEK
jgi:hypothetical protein